MFFLPIEAQPLTIPPVVPIERPAATETHSPAAQDGTVWVCSATHYGIAGRNTVSSGREGNYGTLVAEQNIPQRPVRTLLTRANAIATAQPGTTNTEGRLSGASVELCQASGDTAVARGMKAKVRVRVFDSAQQQ